jgi:S1-C subfamily serine protease
LVAAWLIKDGRVRRAWLGIHGQTAPVHPRIARHLGLKNSAGVLVLDVEAHSPASKVGLRAGDLLVGFQNEPVNSIDDLQRLLVGPKIGVLSKIEIIRHSFRLEMEIVPRETRAVKK